MIHTMSITKAAIGLLCESKKENLLNMVGYSENWDYDDFRKQVEQRNDLKEYALQNIRATNDGRFSYCNLAYQILASECSDLSERFGLLVESPCKGEKEENGLTYFYGDGWKWEHSKGQHLGPHGLWMTEAIATKFGEKAKLQNRLQKGVPLGDGWGGIGKGVFKGYWHGWFHTDNSWFAVGYISQVIAVTPDGVKVRLYEEDWDVWEKYEETRMVEGNNFINSVPKLRF